LANTIKLKRGTSTPTTSDIVDGEVAIDKSAQKLYINDGGSIKEIGGGGGVADGSITTAKLADDAVTTAKLAADAVTASELSNNIVDDNKLAANAVITSKIADDAVTYAKIQNVSATNRILGRDSSGAGSIEEITPANLRTMINVADGANVGITDVVSDTTPQLGGDLDMNSKFISSGILGVKNSGSQSELRLYCESNNAHYAGIKAPAHADFSGDLSFTLPSGYGSNGQVLQSNGSGGTSWVAQTTAYTNSSVDSHLNTSSASSGQILSWNGSDYAWVADQTGGGGGSGISNIVEDTTPQLGGNLDMQSNNISGTGTVIANSTAVATAGMRKIHASTSAPSGSDGAVGDLWVKY